MGGQLAGGLEEKDYDGGRDGELLQQGKMTVRAVTAMTKDNEPPELHWMQEVSATVR